MLYLPESFEWMILKADLLDDKKIREILSDPAKFIDSALYVSWERFFTDLLTSGSKGTYLQYSKKQLNPVYLQKRESEAIIRIVPEIIAK